MAEKCNSLFNLLSVYHCITKF